MKLRSIEEQRAKRSEAARGNDAHKEGTGPEGRRDGAPAARAQGGFGGRRRETPRKPESPRKEERRGSRARPQG